ncbi:MAG: glycoside hydrolase family 25 [Blautia sp.]|nr:glycoside hydrolase family 25 [Lachnoclostridium sp.]MCM1211670.1 glycoside hydrolase family 25 [Blautia sp.]
MKQNHQTDKKRTEFRKGILEDIMDLDADETFTDEEDVEEDEAWETEFGELANKKLLLVIAALGVLVLIVGTIVLSSVLRGQKEDAASVETNAALDTLQEETPQEPENTLESLASDEQDGENNTVTPADDSLEEPDGTEQEASVGALDDEQDPQGSGAAGREESGAEVTVVGIGEGENADITMGIDVSKYQGTIDWSRVKASGVDFAMIRVGYRAKSTGEIFEDPTARYNMQEAQAAGIKIGAYFFSSAVTPEEAKAEAVFTKSVIARYRITYPVAYNCEDFLSSDSRQYGLDAAARTALACAFLDEVAAGGYTPMFYASKGELDQNAQWNTDTLAAKYKIWVAQYPEQPYPATAASTYAGTHAMWQYTSQGIVDGISRKTDVNLAYFGYDKEAEAKDDTPAETVAANPEVGIIFTEVNETVTAKQETNLRTEPSTLSDATIVVRLVHGDTAQRTGIGHNGWSRVIYNGQTLYAVTSYLTTDMEDTGQQAPPQGPIYTPVNEQVTAKMETNLRTEPSTASDDTIVGMLHNGETLTRTAVGDNGWSQLDYNGQTVYAVSSYLMLAQ